MTDPSAVAAAFVIVIGAITTAAVTIIGAIGSMRRAVLDAQAISNSKSDAIHELVNGHSQLAARKLEELQEHVVELQHKLDEARRISR